MEIFSHAEIKSAAAFDIQDALLSGRKVQESSISGMADLANSLLLLSTTGGTLTIKIGKPDFRD